MKRTVIVTMVIFTVSLVALLLFLKLTSPKEENRFAEVRNGFFEIAVSSTGELVAESSVDIRGPNIVRNRNFRATPLKIIDLVPEGTIVKKGDFVASLDKSSFVNTLKEEQDDLRTLQTELQMKILDTAMVLSEQRDEESDQAYKASEAKITLDESRFEPPAIQRQAEITLDKEQRTLGQKKKLYTLKSAQIRAEIKTLRFKVSTQQRKVDDLDSVLAAFTVRAPADGMVIYKKDPLGNKIAVGTTLNPWDPVVATLPDLSVMLSKVYVSEIDVNKISRGMPVEISIDAFSDKSFTGVVTSIANIGEQLQNSDTKVFEVLARLDEYDPMLRPSMTTSNKLVIKTYNNVLFVPNESVHAGMDSIPYVYTRSGTRQVVVLGESNDRNIIVEKGLEAGEKIWLEIPENPEKFHLAGRELIPLIREKELARLER